MKSFTNWPLFLAFKWGWIKKCPLLKSRNGITIEVPALSRFEFKDIFLHEAYGFWKVFEQLPSNPIVLDIGANVGFFSLYALNWRPGASCFSFEPLNSNFRILKQQKELNPKSRWQIFQTAVAGCDGHVKIFSNANGETDASASVKILELKNSMSLNTSQNALAISLQSVFYTNQLRHCDWLKLDCEGSEYEILYNCPDEILRQISIISLETHYIYGVGGHPVDLCAFLIEKGFYLYGADDSVVHAFRS